MEMEIKKILIKFPRDEKEIIQCFPFIVTLSEEFPKAELNIIIEEGCGLALSFLPFKTRVYERPKTKLSLVETHHFCANLDDIFNIDLFLDLENTFNSSFIGFNFRARERVGFDLKWNKYLLTKKYPEPLGLSVEKKSMKLLELYLNRNFSDVRISKDRENGQLIESIDKLFKEPIPRKFLMIMLDNFQNVSKQVDLWKSFFDCFHGQKFIIWSHQDEEIISDLFASIDLGHNDLYMHRAPTTKEMIYLFSKMKGIIVNDVWSEALCNYVGVDSLSFYDKKENFPEYQFFKYRPQRMIFNQDGTIQYYVLDEVRQMNGMNHVVDQIHLNFKL